MSVPKLRFIGVGQVFAPDSPGGLTNYIYKFISFYSDGVVHNPWYGLGLE